MDVGTGRGARVAVESDSYAPSRIAVLTGDTVTWSVVSRFHTVSADDGSWSSPRLFVGDSYSHQFNAPGIVTYYCMIHAFMHGEVDVYDVLLDQPIAPAAPNRPYPLTGRAALAEGTTLSIEADTGHGFGPAGTAVVGADGTFTTHRVSHDHDHLSSGERHHGEHADCAEGARSDGRDQRCAPRRT